jgi:DNA-binding MarR family transcriptional regulator
MVKRLTNPFHGRPTPLGSLLTAAGQRLSAELDRSLREAGFPDLRAAHAPVFMAVDPGGTRITDLAERTRMTKQAVGELVRYLSARGYLEITADPSDRRAKRVALTDRGWRAIDTGEQVIDGFDRWLAQAIGDTAVHQLRDALTQITEAR